MARTRWRAQDLRQAIDCLPVRTREAMLAGLDDNRIIVGAYTDRRGGVCPMLAAHRNGGRTSLASFARAWDRYTGAKRARPASERELRTLRAMLEASLLEPSSDLEAAAAEHRQATRRRDEDGRGRRAASGDRHRARELRNRPGWAWLRVFRRYDDYQAALSEAKAQEHPPERERRETAGIN